MIYNSEEILNFNCNRITGSYQEIFILTYLIFN